LDTPWVFETYESMTKEVCVDCKSGATFDETVDDGCDYTPPLCGEEFVLQGTDACVSDADCTTKANHMTTQDGKCVCAPTWVYDASAEECVCPDG
jgi:hypothetical protein